MKINLELFDGGWLMTIEKENVVQGNEIRSQKVITEYVCRNLHVAIRILENEATQ